MKSRRLFFALWPSEALRQQIDASAQAFRDESHARPIPAENFHVTLVFLGLVSEPLFAPIKDIAAAVTCPPFELHLDRVVTWRRAELLCVIASIMPGELALLVEQLRINLSTLQFEPDHKEFKPHVTLAREWRGPRVEKPCGPFLWPAREFVLVESRPGPRGSRYEILERWPLRSAGA